ncbi:hypothetical protein ACQ4N7_01135 [Nodosilinea sp. AN01ver1]|uniref:hypothetical protein n=1 Tax=Nodosilinea sp. AN01ver1 TaxID=3423362 RepID=UPI003D31DE5B
MMLPNCTAPATGAESVRPCEPWQIYMFRGYQWVPVGACGSRALAEVHISSLRKMMRGYLFQLVWEGEADAA